MFTIQKGLVLPKTVTPFYLNKCLLYQATFDLNGFYPLAELTEIPTAFMSQLAMKLATIAESHFKATTLRQLVFPQWSLTNVFLQVTERAIDDSSNSGEERVHEDVTFKLIGIPTTL